MAVTAKKESVEVKSLSQKLSEIQVGFKAKKSRFNSFGKYNFRSAEDILEGLKPFNKEYDVYFKITESLISTEPLILESVASIVDCSTGETIEAKSIVGIDLMQKGMQAAQCFGSSSSYGKKYSLGNLLLIDDTQDADANNDHTKQPIPDARFQAALKAIANGTFTKEQLTNGFELTPDQIKQLG